MQQQLRIFMLLSSLFGTFFLNAQKSTDVADLRNKGKVILFHLSFHAHVPAGDLSKRFGQNLAIGSGIERMTAQNIIFGAEGHYLFGQQVKEDPLVILRTPEGTIIGADGTLADVVFRQRGWYAGLNFGRLFIRNEKQRAGIRVTNSIGWFQHKIRIQDDTRSVVQITDEYLKGYDRMAGGITLQQFIGWQKLGVDRRNNWMAGIELSQGFTQTLRDWDFSTRQKLDGRRIDLRFGVRLAWTLPFYPRAAETIYY
jgi:hypothetical protein